MNDKRSWLQISLSIVSALIVVYGGFVMIATIVYVAQSDPARATANQQLSEWAMSARVASLEIGLCRGAVTILIGLFGFTATRLIDLAEKIAFELGLIRRNLPPPP